MPDGSHAEQSVELELGARRDLLLGLPPPVVANVSPPPPAADIAPTPSGAPWLAYGALGLGIVGIGIGTGAGISALSKKSTIDLHCDGTVCDHDGKVAADSAKTAAVVSTVGFAAGLVGVAAGVILIAARPRTSRPGAQALVPEVYVDGRGAAVGARGAF